MSCVFHWLFSYVAQWLGTVGSTVFWDALIAHVIVHQAEIRGIGVYTSVELFNEILDLHFDSSAEISQLGKLQIARAVGVAIVKQGSMYPTMELLLRHAIQYLGLRGKAAVSNPGILDNEMDFIMDLSGMDPEDPDTESLSKEEQVVVLSVHLMALMLDGARPVLIHQSQAARLRAVPHCTSFTCVTNSCGLCFAAQCREHRDA